MSRPVCAVDTETTGLGWERQACEIALIRRDHTGTTETVFFVQVDLAPADPTALSIGGFYQRHPYGQHTLQIQRLDGHEYGPQPDGVTYLHQDHAAHVIKRMTHDATIVGAQPHFDTHVFEQMLHRAGLAPSWHYRFRDVESLTAGFQRCDVGGLGDCVEALGLNGDWDAHTAIGDARAALAVFDAILPTAAALEHYAHQLKGEAEQASRGDGSGPTWDELMDESGITEAELADAPSELGDGG